MNNQSPFCYVVLHYKNTSDTEKCIESLLHTTGEKSRIIIVDNGSNDKSGELLKEKYCAEGSRCEILVLDKNLGFSKGNNIGYLFAKEKYSPNFIVVTNNDVVFYQDFFETEVMELFKKNRFHVLGPDVYIPRHNDHQNPLFKTVITVDDLKREIVEYKKYQENPKRFVGRLQVHAIKNMVCTHSRIIRMLYSSIRGKDNLDYKKKCEDVGLQGSCLIFSKLFIVNEDKAFDPEPFLYEEEIFLFLRCREKKYKMVYSPSIAIRHEEGASFNSISKSKIENIRFMLSQHIAAREMLLTSLQEKNAVRDE